MKPSLLFRIVVTVLLTLGIIMGLLISIGQTGPLTPFQMANFGFWFVVLALCFILFPPYGFKTPTFR